MWGVSIPFRHDLFTAAVQLAAVAIIRNDVQNNILFAKYGSLFLISDDETEMKNESMSCVRACVCAMCVRADLYVYQPKHAKPTYMDDLMP